MGAPAEGSVDGPKERRLIDLRPGQFPVIVSGRVIRAERRTVKRQRDGTELPTLVGWLSDGSATVRFTWWDPPEEAIGAGEGLRAGPVDIREWRGRIELSFGRRTHVEPIGELELPADRIEDRPRRAIAEARPGEEDLRLDGTIVRIQPRTVTVRGKERTIFLGEIRDETGSLPFVAWLDLGLTEGARVRLLGASVRSYRDRPEIVLDERVRFERIPEPAAAPPPAPDASAFARIVRAAPAPAAAEERPIAAASEWVSVIRRLAGASPDGYADADQIEEAGGHLPLPDGGIEVLLRALVRQGLVAEPLAGLFRPNPPAGR